MHRSNGTDLIDVWILRPRFEKKSNAPSLQIEILGIGPDGGETDLEKVTLERERFPESWEQEGLLQELVQSQITQGRHQLILDLITLKKADSSDLGEIVAAYQRAQDSGSELVLANLGPKLREIFARTELDRIILVSDSIAEAVHVLDSLQDRPPEENENHPDQLRRQP